MMIPIILLLVLVVFVGADQYLYLKDSSVVLEQVDDVDFEASTRPRVVEFYSPYCG